ncbi:GNAT family N-acetyltransferase [Brevibacillus antibioticus]|uniref:GNAT family N-acetyltransferase n=1 Tax=Brevibacillus antibioticus TaxID=2570228 RepID=A0A4U2Y3U5_9BACL|nr:GNAT family N-acetyltransferase [Brevibacillus antibioticus]TKI55160.1 GNAT family N-acetyltransferase [Brevibacillus antibioticus]
MGEYRLISDYKHIETYKESFNELAKQIFQLDFKEWYNKGFWNDNYVCYSYLDGEQVIANASVSKMIVNINGKDYEALQVGTVMTHPAYRNQGLAAKLMNHIIQRYEKEYDFIYLYANDTVLDFYPKFGFERIQESSFCLLASDLKKQVEQKAVLRKLEVDSEADYLVMKEFVAKRIPVSSRLGVKNSEQLVMFYFLLVFRDAIYYVEEQDVIVLFERAEDQLHVFDLVSKKPVDIEAVISHLVTDETAIIHFHFMPDSENEKIQSALMTTTDDVLFVRPSFKMEIEHFRFPLTSHA